MMTANPDPILTAEAVRTLADSLAYSQRVGDAYNGCCVWFDCQGRHWTKKVDICYPRDIYGILMLDQGPSCVWNWHDDRGWLKTVLVPIVDSMRIEGSELVIVGRTKKTDGWRSTSCRFRIEGLLPEISMPGPKAVHGRKQSTLEAWA